MKPLRIGIVGASSLKGKEIKEAIENSSLAASDLALLDDETSLGKLEEVKEEATFIRAVNEESLEDLDLAFFAGDADLTRSHYESARRADSIIVDSSYALEREPGFPVRSPWLEDESGSHPPLDALGFVTAHPVATMLALLLTRLKQAGSLRVATATVLQPASETGSAGMDELHQQTVNLLNFQSLPKAVFDTQVAFNLVPEFGSGIATSLHTVAQRIRQHADEIAPDLPPLSVHVIAAPVFHGYTVSLFLEFDHKVDAASITRALNHPRLHVIETEADAQDAPSNVNAAGEDRITLSWAPEDLNPAALWIWAAVDNLKLTALTAVECARRMATLRTSGQVQ